MRRQKRSELNHRVQLLNAAIGEVSRVVSGGTAGNLDFMLHDTAYVLHTLPENRIETINIVSHWMANSYFVLARVSFLPRYSSKINLQLVVNNAETAFRDLMIELSNAGFVYRHQTNSYSYSIR